MPNNILDGKSVKCIEQDSGCLGLVIQVKLPLTLVGLINCKVIPAIRNHLLKVEE